MMTSFLNLKKKENQHEITVLFKKIVNKMFKFK